MSLLLTADQLFHAVLELSREKAEELLPDVRVMLGEAHADTPERAACMLAQTAHESCGLLVLREVWGPTAAQLAYERPVVNGQLAPLVTMGHIPLWQRLGNLRPGDGELFAGDGWIQLTGGANHRAAGEAVGLPLFEQPELAERVDVAARTAAWYWRERVPAAQTDLATEEALQAVTHAVNGGLNGLDLRRKRWAHARAALGLAEVCAERAR